MTECLLAIVNLGGPLISGGSSGVPLAPHEVEPFLIDLARRWENDGLEDVIGPSANALVFEKDLLRQQEGIGGGDGGWRRVIAAFEALVSVKPIAAVLPRLPTWSPEEATAPTLEVVSLMGPLLRLSAFGREWVGKFCSSW